MKYPRIKIRDVGSLEEDNTFITIPEIQIPENYIIIYTILEEIRDLLYGNYSKLAFTLYDGLLNYIKINGLGNKIGIIEVFNVDTKELCKTIYIQSKCVRKK